MAKRLTARSVETENRAGYHSDSDQKGLYLQVVTGRSGPNRSWVFRYTSPVTRKRRDMGLGATGDIGLAEARRAAQAARSALVQGIDPLNQRKAETASRRAESARTVTFSSAAASCIKAKAPEWSNAKHAAQWSSTLATYADPVIGTMAVADITVNDVMRVLEPIWTVKTETATRVRQRIEAVLDWAKARGYRSGMNPASLTGDLEQLLPRSAKVKKVVHHPALPCEKTHDFITDLRARQGISTIALEFLILTAARTGEVINATWEEFDLTKAIWTIPAARMKAKREHRVPLSRRVVEILNCLRDTATSPYVFPGNGLKKPRPLSSAAMLKLMRGMDAYKNYVPHGFRSTFRDWAAEETNYAHETIEMALAHTIKNKTEAAYRRGDLLEKRRSLMDAWAGYVEAAPRSRDNSGNVHPIRKAN